MKFIASLTLTLIVLISACAPEDLDYTPTAPPPTATYTPTPRPTGVAAELDPKETRLNLIKQIVPDRISANGDWSRDQNFGTNGFDVPINLQVGLGTRVSYRDQTGGTAEITYVVFDNPDDARTHFDRFVNEVRAQQLSTGRSIQTLPEPNMTGGSATVGSFALFIVDEIYFVEVFVKNYSSTLGDPRNGMATNAWGVVQEAILRHNTPDAKPAQIEALKAVIPTELTIGERIWTQRSVRDVRDINYGLGATIFYRDDATREEFSITYVVFDLEQDAVNYYSQRLRDGNTIELRLDFNRGETRADYAGVTNRFISGNVDSAAAIFQLGGVHYMEIFVQLNEGSATELIDLVAQEAFNIFNTGVTGTASPTPEPEGTPASPFG